jgi:hypothetical protein
MGYRRLVWGGGVEGVDGVNDQRGAAAKRGGVIGVEGVEGVNDEEDGAATRSLLFFSLIRRREKEREQRDYTFYTFYTRVEETASPEEEADPAVPLLWGEAGATSGALPLAARAAQPVPRRACRS